MLLCVESGLSHVLVYCDSCISVITLHLDYFVYNPQIRWIVNNDLIYLSTLRIIDIYTYLVMWKVVDWILVSSPLES